MAEDNDEIFGAPPRKAASSHAIGQSLDDLSVQEIDERITTLQAEITRLEEARSAKQTSLSDLRREAWSLTHLKSSF